MSNPLQISEAASLAFHAMVFLASRPGQRVSTQKMSERFDASSATLAKVMRQLTRAGLVDSASGPGGGFTLTDPAEEITLVQVYEAVEGSLTPISCFLDEPACREESCIFGSELSEIDEKLRRWLTSTTLAELAPAFAPHMAS